MSTREGPNILNDRELTRVYTQSDAPLIETEQVAMPERVLVVDDEPAIRELVRQVLEREGYETVIATDGNAAMRELEQGYFDLMLCDVRMPGLDGMQVLQRAVKLDRDMPVIIDRKSVGRERV